MRSKLVVAVFLAPALLTLSACVTTKVLHTTRPREAPPAEAVVVLMEPDVQLSLLTVSGLAEPRADWTDQAKRNIEKHVSSRLQTKSRRTVALDEHQPLTDRQLQLVRLHEAVGRTILTFKQGYISLPTKKDAFDWSLGPGARVIGEEQGADYALFVRAEGEYASGARAAAAIAGALLGVGMRTGYQVAFASLVDLRTGDIVWFNLATTGESNDLRDDDGSASMVAALLKDIPL